MNAPTSASLRTLSEPQRTLLCRLLDEQAVSSARGLVERIHLKQQLQQALQAQLPDHMQPASFTFLSAIPLTHNGKLDVRGLPSPDLESGRSRTAPRNPIEAALLEVWEQLLGRTGLCIDDDFFASGGNSVKAVELASRMNQRFQTQLPAALVFAAPTIAQLAEKLELLQEIATPELHEVGVELPVTQLQAEAALDPAVLPPTAAPAPPETWQALLLTGGTGYFGSHLLSRLLRDTRATVYCLVRAPSPQAALARLRESAARYLPDREFLAARVVPVVGDLSLPRWGLDAATFAQLAERIDAVFHAGAIVNFAYTLDALRSANVEGARELMRFAASARPKAVHYVSTIHVFSSTQLRSEQRIGEGYDLTHVRSVFGGYAQSRFIGEGIARLAQRRGQALSIYRPAIIAGDAETGVSNPNDLLYRTFVACTELGCVPRLSTHMNIVTADYASEALVALARDPASLGGTFHLVNRTATSWSELIEALGAYGYDLQVLHYRHWYERIEAAGPGNALYPLLPLIKHAGVAEALGMRPPSFDDARAAAVLHPRGLVCPPIDRPLIGKFLDAMVQSGALRRPS